MAKIKMGCKYDAFAAEWPMSIDDSDGATECATDLNRKNELAPRVFALPPGKSCAVVNVWPSYVPVTDSDGAGA